MRNIFLPSLLLLCSASVNAQQVGVANPGVIGLVQSPDATVRGSVAVGSAGTSLMSGSQISAGESSAILKLSRGGALQVCKRSSITLTSSNSGREMLVALNAGAIETHYVLASTSDTVITPDFRITLAGPGEFHFAIGTSANGGMCVKSLAGNASSVIVNEQFGEGAHQVKPGEQVTFHNGRVDDFAAEAGECGCPNPRQPETPAGLSFPEQQSRNAEQAAVAGRPIARGEGVPMPPAKAASPGQTVTQVDAPMVVRAEDLPPPQPSVALNRLPLWPVGRSALPQAEAPQKAAKKPWYKRFGNAVASLFAGGNPSRKTP